MEDHTGYVLAKFGMWLLCLIAFIGWFLLALFRHDAAAAYFSGLCFLLLLFIPLLASRLRHH
jgi:hypothetical protein